MLRNKNKLMEIRPPSGRHAGRRSLAALKTIGKAARDGPGCRARSSGKQGGNALARVHARYPAPEPRHRIDSTLSMDDRSGPSLKRHPVLDDLRPMLQVLVGSNRWLGPHHCWKKQPTDGPLPTFSSSQPRDPCKSTAMGTARYEVWSSTGNRRQATAYPCSVIWTAYVCNVREEQP